MNHCQGFVDAKRLLHQGNGTEAEIAALKAESWEFHSAQARVKRDLACKLALGAGPTSKRARQNAMWFVGDAIGGDPQAKTISPLGKRLIDSWWPTQRGRGLAVKQWKAFDMFRAPVAAAVVDSIQARQWKTGDAQKVFLAFAEKVGMLLRSSLFALIRFSIRPLRRQMRMIFEGAVVPATAESADCVASCRNVVGLLRKLEEGNDRQTPADLLFRRAATFKLGRAAGDCKLAATREDADGFFVTMGRACWDALKTQLNLSHVSDEDLSATTLGNGEQVKVEMRVRWLESLER